MKDQTGEGRCEACGARMPGESRFCPECGAATDRVVGLSCPACGRSQPEEFDFCPGCGAHLGTIARAERRVITVLFADLCGFTRITERLDPEGVHVLSASCLEPLAECAIRWGGTVDKFIGDSVMALFGVPEGHENEPERAVRAALDMQRTLEAWEPGDDFAIQLAEGARPELGIGVNTGPVVTGIFSAGDACDYTAVGDVVNVASRLESVCEPGEILVGEKTYRETRGVFEFGEGRVLQVKGREEPVEARRVRGERSERPAGVAVGGRDVVLVNRRDELERLRESWADATAGKARSLLIAGPAGTGKSRLVEELVSVEELSAEQVARGRVRPHSSPVPWGAIAELLGDLHGLPSALEPGRAAAEIARARPGRWREAEVSALSVALGRSADEVEELADRSPAARRRAVGKAVTKALGGDDGEPRLLLLENLQWADRSTVEYLARRPGPSLSGPRLLLAVTRPPLPGEPALAELFESPVPRLDVGPLSPGDMEAVLEAHLGEDHRLPESLVERIVARAEGNPLFLEEILGSLVERGSIRRRDGSWRLVDEPRRLGVPDGVESLISTRVDSLPSSTKRVLQCASVVGRRFWPGLLAEVLLERPVDEDLEHLREGALIHPAAESRIPGEREYEFDHGYLREVAYRSLLRSRRAELHREVAAWLEEKPGESVPGYHRLVARHWERSDEPDRAEGHREEAGRG